MKNIKYLNNKYRKNNNYTNILTFKYNFLNFKKKYIGEIILCNKIIFKESIKYNININDHYAHIIIHGCLHLLNINHNNKKMKT